MSRDLEPVYDDLISPLMSQILTICHEFGVPMVATFQLSDDEGDELFCSSAVPADWQCERMAELNRVITRHARGVESQSFALTVRRTGGDDG